MIQYTDFLYGCYRTALKDARTDVLLLLLLLLFCYEELSLVKD